MVTRASWLGVRLRVAMLWALGAFCMSSLIAYAQIGGPSCPCTYTHGTLGPCGGYIEENCDGVCRTFYMIGQSAHFKWTTCGIPECDQTHGSSVPDICCTGPDPIYWLEWYADPQEVYDNNCDDPPPPPTCTGSCMWESSDLGGQPLFWHLSGTGCNAGLGCGCACPETGPTGLGQIVFTPCYSGGPSPPDCTYGPPPDPCDTHGGDTDGDGCCDDVDCYTNDPMLCTCDPGPCDTHGGDGDGDGCCADVDYDDADPQVCDPPPPPGCTGNCPYTSAKDDEGRFYWVISSPVTCMGTSCHCCPPLARPTALQQSANGTCTTASPCPKLCDSHGGDDDDDDCCDDDDHDSDDPQVCNGMCDGWKKRCVRRYPGQDGDLGTDDDLLVECDPEVEGSPNEPECECERMKNGDRDHDKCCDFDERSEEEAEDPEKGCECCRIEEQWRKAKGCLVQWEWNRIWGNGPGLVMEEPENPDEPPERPTECTEEGECVGVQIYTGALDPQGKLYWSSGSNFCSGSGGAGCHGCPPLSPPLRAGQEVRQPCQLAACGDGYDLPQGDPTDFFEVQFPISNVTNEMLTDIEIKLPITLQGWKDWLQSASGSGTGGGVFDAIDDYRQFLRNACLWVVGVMLAGIVFKELRV